MARAGFNVNNFLARIAENGVQKNNKFLVRFPLPQGLFTTGGQAQFMNTARDLEYWCDSASIPGVALLTHSVLRYGYGTSEKKPYAIQFSDANFTFLADGKTAIWTLFQQWINRTIKYSVPDGFAADSATSGSYEVAYRGDYTVDINVLAFNEVGDVTMNIVLREAFPIFVGEMPLNMADGSLAHVPVTFAFNDWYNNAFVTPFPDIRN